MQTSRVPATSTRCLAEVNPEQPCTDTQGAVILLELRGSKTTLEVLTYLCLSYIIMIIMSNIEEFHA